ncbi:hypothetical protein [Sulfolobus sp. E11-6]|uniref:hypothetical protein n=1 Tax=Sulfolobus sp. E11-6 TaxID=2663020 RepID=UPI001EEB8B62|nr:hypothetical protein [Sulfolobus sp. E11-6]
MSDCLVPVYEKLKLLQEFGDYLERNTLNRSLDRIDPQLLPYFLGGVNENGEYTKGSLARLISYMYNEEVDTSKLANSIKVGMKNPYSEVNVRKVSRSSFIDLLNKTVEKLESLFHKVNVNIDTPSSIEIESITKNVDKFMQTINDYIYKAKLILPMYNYYSFLIVTTRHLPASIFLDSYPQELVEDRNLRYDFLGLGILPIPFISDKEQSYRLGLTGHISNSVSDIIFTIIANNLFMVNRLYNVIKNNEESYLVTKPFIDEYYQFMADVLRKSSIIVSASDLFNCHHMEIRYKQDLSVEVCYCSAPSYCEYNSYRAIWRNYKTISDMYKDPEIISKLFANGYLNIAVGDTQKEFIIILDNSL